MTKSKHWKRVGRSKAMLSACVLLCAGITACDDSEPAEVASNCEADKSCVESKQNALAQIDKVDILVVIDSSGSINEEAESLKAELPRMMNAMINGSDEDTSFPPASSVHVAVVTSDLGAGGENLSGCEGVGDDGIFLRPGEVGVTCDVDYPGFLAYEGGSAPIATVNTVSCVPLTGIDGCGYEHSLEAGLKALWPASDDSIEFRDGTGHGEDANEGFLRQDSLLVVIVVTDEDDCSAEDPSIFSRDPASSYANQPANLRCHFNPDALHPIQRYIDGFKTLRPGNDNVVFATIAGVPPDLLSDGATARFESAEEREAFYEGVLTDPRMQELVDDDAISGSLHPSCVTEHAKAMPPRRLVNVARAFGENGVVGSICAENFGGMTGAIIHTVGARLIEAEAAAQAAESSGGAS